MFNLRLKDMASTNDASSDKGCLQPLIINGKSKGPDDGFSMLEKKEILDYVDLLEVSSIEEPIKI